MSDYTEHYNLKKPKQTESYNVEDANSNNDIIDKTLFEKQDKETGKGLSTNDFTNLYKKKLDSLFNYDDTSITKKIESLDERKVDAKDLEKLAEENEFLRENQLYGEAIGRNINLQDSAKAHINLKVKGSTSQITRSGKNLYNKGNVSDTRMVEVPINELLAGTYTLSALATSSDTDRTQCLVLDATNNKNLGYLNRNVRSSFTFTLEKPTKKLNFYASTTYNLGENDTFKFADIQIEQGTTATEYEQYGASPSPDYPSEIENVEGINH